jgi:hypothetical protein
LRPTNAPIGRAGGAPPELELLATLVEQLVVDGVPLSEEFLEMVHARVPGNPAAGGPTFAASELLAEPMTPAETAAANVVASAARLARDLDLTDTQSFRLIALATLYAARFETYVVASFP